MTIGLLRLRGGRLEEVLGSAGGLAIGDGGRAGAGDYRGHHHHLVVPMPGGGG